MKQSLRLAFLVGVLGCASWLSTQGKAVAFPAIPCNELQGTTCSVEGGVKQCFSVKCEAIFNCTCQGVPKTTWSCPSC
jgi:hypothetical protein